MYCRQCGNKLPDGASSCEKCGCPVDGHPSVGNGQGASRNYNIMSIIGLTVAVMSLFVNFYGAVGLAAVITSAIGLRQSKKKGENGAPLAAAGIVVGIFSLFYGVYVLFMYLS